MPLNKTILEKSYRVDCEKFARSLYPQVCTFFFDWLCVNFPYGQPIWVPNEVTISDCYGPVHKGWSAVSRSGSKLPHDYRKVENQALARWQKQLAMQKAMGEGTKAISGETVQKGRVTPNTMVETLLSSCTRRGEPWGEIWNRQLVQIAQGIAEEVARDYVKNNCSEVVRLMGFKAASDQESAPIKFSEALDGKKIAYAALHDWPTAIDTPIREISIGSIQSYLSEEGHVAVRNRRAYTYERQALCERLDADSQAVGLYPSETETKFFKNQKTREYARMALRLSPRDLALVAYTGRIKCDPPLRAQLIQPIIEEMNRDLAALKKQLQPMNITWTQPKFAPLPATKEAV